MSRTHISVDAETLRRARRQASRLDISLAEYVRRLLRNDLQGAVPRADPASIFDLGDAGGADIAREKERLIGEAVAAEQARRTRGR